MEQFCPRNDNVSWETKRQRVVHLDIDNCMDCAINCHAYHELFQLCNMIACILAMHACACKNDNVSWETKRQRVVHWDIDIGKIVQYMEEHLCNMPEMLHCNILQDCKHCIIRHASAKTTLFRGKRQRVVH